MVYIKKKKGQKEIYLGYNLSKQPWRENKFYQRYLEYMNICINKYNSKHIYLDIDYLILSHIMGRK